LDTAREVLASYERLDYICDSTLLMHIDKRLQVHRFRKRSQGREYFRVRRWVKVGCDRINPNHTIGSGWIDKSRQLVRAMEL